MNKCRQHVLTHLSSRYGNLFRNPLMKSCRQFWYAHCLVTFFLMAPVFNPEACCAENTKNIFWKQSHCWLPWQHQDIPSLSHHLWNICNLHALSSCQNETKTSLRFSRNAYITGFWKYLLEENQSENFICEFKPNSYAGQSSLHDWWLLF